MAAKPLDGRLVIVATQGLPEEVALAVELVGQGAVVVAAGPDAVQGGRILRAIQDANEGRGAYFAHDGSPGSTAALIEFVAEQFRSVGPKPEVSTVANLAYVAPANAPAG